MFLDSQIEYFVKVVINTESAPKKMVEDTVGKNPSSKDEMWGKSRKG